MINLPHPRTNNVTDRNAHHFSSPSSLLSPPTPPVPSAPRPSLPAPSRVFSSSSRPRRAISVSLRQVVGQSGSAVSSSSRRPTGTAGRAVTAVVGAADRSPGVVCVAGVPHYVCRGPIINRAVGSGDLGALRHSDETSLATCAGGDHAAGAALSPISGGSRPVGSPSDAIEYGDASRGRAGRVICFKVNRRPPVPGASRVLEPGFRCPGSDRDELPSGPQRTGSAPVLRRSRNGATELHRDGFRLLSVINCFTACLGWTWREQAKC